MAISEVVHDEQRLATPRVIPVHRTSQWASLERTEVRRVPVPGLTSSLRRPESGPVLRVQRSLDVGAADDPLELEADRVAATVVSQLRRRTDHSHAEEADGSCCASPGDVRRSVRRSADGEPAVIGLAGGALSAQNEARLRADRGSGTAISAAVRGPLEQAFGTDLSAVRLHAGSEATALNRSMSAQAFTHGRDIYFRDGLPDTGTDAGLHLLSHELTHTLQQGSA